MVGAAVLIVIAVIFIPMLLTGPIDAGSISGTNIPARTAKKFNPRLIPIDNSATSGSPINMNAEMLEEQPITDDLKDEPKIKPKANSPNKTELISAVEVSSKKLASNKTVKDKPVGLTAWVVQLGSFSSKVNADKLNLTLRKSGFPAFVEPLEKNNGVAYRVRVGPELLRADADALLKKIKENTKLDGIVLNYP